MNKAQQVADRAFWLGFTVGVVWACVVTLGLLWVSGAL